MTGRVCRPCPLLALLCLSFLAAGTAAADAVVEMRSTSNLMMFGRLDMRMTCSLRPDRARLESWSRPGATAPGDDTGPTEKPLLTLVRCDLGVSWITEYGDTTYTEAPWPDTLTCPPSPLPEGFADSIAGLDPIESLDWMQDVTRTGRRDTIAGYPAEHFVVRAVGHAGERAARARLRQIEEMREIDPSFDPKSWPETAPDMVIVHDLWFAPGLPAGLDSLWARFLDRTIRNDGAACVPRASRTDSIEASISRLHGTCLRYRTSIELAGGTEMVRRAAEQLRHSATTQEGSLAGLVDVEKGMLLLGSFEVVSIREEAVPDRRYEIPVGMRKVPRVTEWDALEQMRGD